MIRAVLFIGTLNILLILHFKLYSLADFPNAVSPYILPLLSLNSGNPGTALGIGSAPGIPEYLIYIIIHFYLFILSIYFYLFQFIYLFLFLQSPFNFFTTRSRTHHTTPPHTPQIPHHRTPHPPHHPTPPPPGEGAPTQKWIYRTFCRDVLPKSVGKMTPRQGVYH